MQRIVEPEIMDDAEQAAAYDKADFSKSHSRRVELFKLSAPSRVFNGLVLDLGTGSGDILFRFAEAFPSTSYIGIDGSRAMLDLAEQRLGRSPKLTERVKFTEGYIPSDQIPREQYSVIMCHSLLHHLHDPGVLWNTIADLMNRETFVFVADLRRPQSPEQAQAIVEELASGEPQILKRDFFNSLCASFTVSEVRTQLAAAKLDWLSVEEVDDIHLMIYGTRNLKAAE